MMAGAGSHRATTSGIYTPAPRNRAAHRAAPAPDDPANIPFPPAPATRTRHRAPTPLGPKRLSTFTIGAVTGTIMMIQMGLPTVQTSVVAQAAPEPAPAPITADAAAVLSNARPEVLTEPAPPPIIVTPPVVAIVPLPVVPPPAQAPVLLAPAATAPPPPPPAGGKGAIIAAAARAQLGWTQDCVAMASRALAAAGISWYDWPIGVFNIGYQVSYAEAQPGDLIYYANGGAGVAHVAVYAGNGQAYHGGYNGNQTVLSTAFVGSGPVFVRV